MLVGDRGRLGTEAMEISGRTQQVQRPRGTNVLGNVSGTVRIWGTVQRADAKKERRDKGPGRWRWHLNHLKQPSATHCPGAGTKES